MPEETASRHATEPWTYNRADACSIDEAMEIARKHGVNVPEYIVVGVYEDAVPAGAHASYAMLGERRATSIIRWHELLNRFGQVPVHLRRDVLRSDEAIVAVFAHEVYEIKKLRELFERNDGVLSASRLREATSPDIPGNLHWEAVDFADSIVRAMRAR